jgi:uncharacterized membrane protein required for colicin V production
MTSIDWLVIGLLVVYTAGGFFTGVIRRLIGLVALYLGLLAATNMGLQAGGILQQSSNFDVPDARIYGFFGILTAILVIVEAATQLAHSQIQIPALLFNNALGAIAGLITAVLLSVVLVYELGAAGNPFGGSQLDPLQQKIRDAYQGSHIVVPIVHQVQRPIINIFAGALPDDPQIYFGPSPVNP